MKQKKEELLKEMLELAKQALVTGQEMKSMDLPLLNKKPAPESWSALECLEHLNLYGDFYLPEMERRILAAKPQSNEEYFKSGLFGNYFAQLMRIDNGPIKKMQSPKDKRPDISDLNVNTVDRFIKQTERLINLIHLSESVSLNHTKCSISISALIRLRLGDTFRFYIYHIIRHLAQAKRALTS